MCSAGSRIFPSDIHVQTRPTSSMGWLIDRNLSLSMENTGKTKNNPFSCVSLLYLNFRGTSDFQVWTELLDQPPEKIHKSLIPLMREIWPI